jgi:molybdate/tungstate transport system ATP-binding protein
LIEAKVKKRFGFFGLDAEILGEKVICLTGKNGSGKTTLLNIIAGTLSPDEGFVRLNSIDVTRLPVERRSITFVTPDSHIPHLKVQEHLVWGAKNKGVKIDEKTVLRVKERLGIGFANIKARNLSIGMRERVSLATALLSRPKAILVDEAFSNIDNRKEFISSFRELILEMGIDLIFATQEASDSELADHHYVMEQGKSNRLF